MRFYKNLVLISKKSNFICKGEAIRKGKARIFVGTFVKSPHAPKTLRAKMGKCTPFEKAPPQKSRLLFVLIFKIKKESDSHFFILVFVNCFVLYNIRIISQKGCIR